MASTINFPFSVRDRLNSRISSDRRSRRQGPSPQSGRDLRRWCSPSRTGPRLAGTSITIAANVPGVAAAVRCPLESGSLFLQFRRCPQARLPDNRIASLFGKFSIPCGELAQFARILRPAFVHIDRHRVLARVTHMCRPETDRRSFLKRYRGGAPSAPISRRKGKRLNRSPVQE